MSRGMGAQTVVLVKRRGFPRGMASFFSHPVAAPLPAMGGPIRCGMGQGDQQTFQDVNGITADQYLSDQAGYTPTSSTPSTNYGALIAAATPGILTGVAQVVKAANTPGVAYSGVGVPTTSTAVASSSSSGLLLLVVIAAMAAMALGSKK